MDPPYFPSFKDWFGKRQVPSERRPSRRWFTTHVGVLGTNWSDANEVPGRNFSPFVPTRPCADNHGNLCVMIRAFGSEKRFTGRPLSLVIGLLAVWHRPAGNVVNSRRDRHEGRRAAVSRPYGHYHPGMTRLVRALHPRDRYRTVNREFIFRSIVSSHDATLPYRAYIYFLNLLRLKKNHSIYSWFFLKSHNQL